MAVKKSASPKKAASEQSAQSAQKKPAFGSVWTLPIAMLMLTVAASGLWFALRESSNTSQAATPAATREVMTSDAGKASMKPAPAPAPTAPAAAASGDAMKSSDATHPGVAKPVSITGCLQRADRGFLLKDTEGADAPKSRSWKSGFMKRSSAPVMLSDAGNASHLADHVGQRVSVTGPLMDREMRVQSLHRVAAACQ